VSTRILYSSKICLKKNNGNLLKYTIFNQTFQDVLEIGKLPSVLIELKTILMSPIKTPNNVERRSMNCDDLSTDGTVIQTFSEEDEDHLDRVGNEKQSTATTTRDTGDVVSDINESRKDDDEINGDEVGDDDDLPSVIVRVMGKACTQILVTQPDEECCLTYLGLLERVLTHEAFSQNDKRRLQSWKAQCQKLARNLALNRKLAGIDKGPKKYVTMSI